MPRSRILALDVGTHAARALLYDARGRCLGASQRPLSIAHPAADRSEQDAGEILAACRALLAEQSPGRADALGIAVQRSSVCFWDREDIRPLAPMLGWQDTRGAASLKVLAPDAAEIARRTGLRLSPHYGASKLAWMLAHAGEHPGPAAALAGGSLVMGPLAAWLHAGLCSTRDARVDHANASRTLLWNLDSRDWDPWLTERFQLPGEALPRCAPIRCDHGEVAGRGLPVRAMSGDQNAALFADASPAPDTALINLGTGAFVLRSTGDRPLRHDALLTGIADSGNESAQYLIEGTVNGAGAALDWAARSWNLSPIAPRLDAFLSSQAEPALFLNTVGGLGSPFWRADLPPRLLDEERYLRDGRPRDPRAESALVQGLAESVLFLVHANLELLRRGKTLRALRVSGGLSQSRALCRRLASLTGLPVECVSQPEATARGIAWLAAGGPADWIAAECERIEARADAALEARYETWRRAMDSYIANA